MFSDWIGADRLSSVGDKYLLFAMAANFVFGFHACKRDEFDLQNGNEARVVFGIVVVVYGQCLVTLPSGDSNNKVFIKRKYCTERLF